MKNFIGKYQQQEQENQVFLGKKLEIQVNLFIQGFNCQEQMTFYYLNALGMWEYNERNFDKVLMQACVKISYLLYNAHQLLLRGEYGLRIFCCVRSLNIWLSVNISISNRMKYGQKNGWKTGNMRCMIKFCGF